MNNMPSMPSIPSAPSSSGEAQASQAPFTEDSVGNSAGSNVELSAPQHVDESPVAQDIDPAGPAPQIQVSLPHPTNEVKAPLALKGGIKVVATRKGFYNQMRYKEGEQFTIRSEEEFGEWMKCIDPSMEKKRLESYKQKKLKAKKDV